MFLCSSCGHVEIPSYSRIPFQLPSVYSPSPAAQSCSLKFKAIRPWDTTSGSSAGHISKLPSVVPATKPTEGGVTLTSAGFLAAHTPEQTIRWYPPCPEMTITSLD